jgi:DNA replication and repair protein RecF
MTLRRLELRQFRNHPRARMALDGRPAALFGPNGAGKTNLLEAVSMLSPGRGLRRAGAGELARAGGPGGWRVRATLEDGAELAVEAEPEGRKRATLDGKAATLSALGARLPMLWLTPPMDRLWTEGAEGRRRFIDRAAYSFFPAHADAALAYDKAMRERNRLLRDGPEHPDWLAGLEARMAAAGAELAWGRAAAMRRLEAAQAGAATAFPLAALALEGELETAAARAPEAWTPAAMAEPAAGFRARLARARRDDAFAGRALEGPHRSDLLATYAAKGIEARLASTGEQKALLVSLILANARALAAERGAPPLLLLDEVAAHLDAARRAALYDEIVALGAQAFMTGAGAEVFEPLGRRAQRFAVAEGPDGAELVPA